jgi:hypothetical protein
MTSELTEDDKDLLSEYYEIFLCDTEYTKGLIRNMYFGAKGNQKLEAENNELRIIKLHNNDYIKRLEQENQSLKQLEKAIRELPKFIKDHQEQVSNSSCSELSKTLIIGNINTILGKLQNLLDSTTGYNT